MLGVQCRGGRALARPMEAFWTSRCAVLRKRGKRSSAAQGKQTVANSGGQKSVGDDDRNEAGLEGGLIDRDLILGKVAGEVCD